MPSSTKTRSSRPTSPSSLTEHPITPARSSHTRRSSTAYTPTVVSGGQQQRLNIVTRVAVEGRAKQGKDGAAIKAYLKIAVPLDTVTPGTTISLFPEENIKVLASQVHPLDNNSIPYNFSSTLSPLLHNAARALNLPQRSQETFYSAFGLPVENSSIQASSSPSHRMEVNVSTSTEAVAPVDAYYSGRILVSNYAVSYVLPKVFPSRNRCGNGVSPDPESESFSRQRSRRSSIGERNTALFMAAIDMWVPYASKPPRSPYLLSIPIPRCLHNHIKLRIFPPTSTSSSLASLSSVDDDISTWDLASDPLVTRVTHNRLSRTNSYNHFADDESSDSSQAGFSDGCVLRGTFPSAERIRVRWAKPIKIIDAPGTGDGRRRVGVREVKGEMTCTIQGKLKDPERSLDGVVMSVEYKGTCKGVWFPGVATLLGLDVGLEAKNSDVSWVPGRSQSWEVGGGAGYTGFDFGIKSMPSPISRNSSLDSDSPHLKVSTSSPGLSHDPDHHLNESEAHLISNSLLRAPLPPQTTDYSFEGGGDSTSVVGTVSSVSASMHTSTEGDPVSPPGTPITLHVNMNELLPPVQNVFTFTISGTILVTPRMTLARMNRQGSKWLGQATLEDVDPEPVVLPRFTVLAADAEATSILVRSEIESDEYTLEVYNSTGDVKDAQTRKTVLQKGAFTKCGEDGGRIILKCVRPPNGLTFDPPSRSRTPSGQTLYRVPSNNSLPRLGFIGRPKRDGPLIIPAIKAKITWLTPTTGTLPTSYAARISLDIPSDANSEWLEFGLARTHSGAITKISVVNATVDGVPVRFEVTTTSHFEKSTGTGVAVSFEEMHGKEWAIWVRLHVGMFGGSRAIIDYLVKKEDESDKDSRRQEGLIRQLLLPSFSLPVGRLEACVDAVPGSSMIVVDTNLLYQRHSNAKYKLLHFSMREHFVPSLSLSLRHKAGWKFVFSFSSFARIIPWLFIIVILVLLRQANVQMNQLTLSLEQHTSAITTTVNFTPEPTTVTTTVTTTVYTTTTVLATADPVATPDFYDSSTRRLDNILSSSSADITPHSMEITRTREITIMTAEPAQTNALTTSNHIYTSSWPPENLHVIDVVVDRMWDAAEVVWFIIRKAYHYPLDPP